ncbi:MAG: hypothetical protein HQ446_00510, partial [Polaromonas sp.]|nr:hypothetical protein [Polaromonas sp.]
MILLNPLSLMLNHLHKTTCGQVTTLALSVLLSISAQAQTAMPTGGTSAATTDAAPSFGTGRSGLQQQGAQQQLQQQSGQQTTQQQAAAEAAASAAKAAGLDSNTPEAQRVQPPLRASEPSQFQRFVQESTGRLLPMYG